MEPSALKIKLGLIKAAKQEQKARDDACTVMQIAVSMSPLDVDVRAAEGAMDLAEAAGVASRELSAARLQIDEAKAAQQRRDAARAAM